MRDPQVSPVLKVVFLPDFNVKNAQPVYPAADLSEQISTAGKEASGTGNMKFAMNGALTIGTMDGANVEIRDAVGPENFFLFGLTAPEVAGVKAAGYRPRDLYQANDQLRETIDLIDSGAFANGDRELVPAAGRVAAGARRLPAVRRLPGLRGLPGARERGLPRRRRLDADVDPELRARRAVLLGSFDPGLLPVYLAGETDGVGPGLSHDRAAGRPSGIWRKAHGQPAFEPGIDRQSVATLPAGELELIDAYWRACNYLAVGMIYLQDNPLLRDPLRLEHAKPRLLGHWGASPALSFVWVHLNRLIVRDDLDVIFVAGPWSWRTRRARPGLSRRYLFRDLSRQERGPRGHAEILQAVLLSRPHRQSRDTGDAGIHPRRW